MNLTAEPTDRPEPRLLRKIAFGDRKALAELYDRTSPILFGLVLRIVRDRSEAEDVLQEVYTQVWERAVSYREERGTARAWLFTIARTRALDRLRSRGARLRAVDRAAAEPVSSTTHDPAEEAALRADRVVLAKALTELPAKEVEVLRLAYFEGLSQTEIAERLERPLGTVKTQVRQGLLRLRDLLGDRREDVL